MNRLTIAAVLAAVILCCSLPAGAQTPRPRLSPHETISTVIDTNRVMIVYGRPFSKKAGTTEVRKIWGGLVPFDQIWRTGADEATLLIIQKPIVIAGTTIPGGTAYSIFTLPAADGSCKFIVNKQIGQWGIEPNNPTDVYDQKNDVVRADMTKSDLDTQLDQFEMAISKNPDTTVGGGLIKMKWEKLQYAVPFTVVK
jgi:hypothetical protein